MRLHRTRLTRRHALLPWLLLVVLAACGGGGGTSHEAPVAEPEPTGPGQLIAATELNRIAVADIEAAARQAGSRAPASLRPRYDVVNQRLEYLSADAQGRAVVASGLVSVPAKAPGARSPVLSYQHGTIFKNAEAPSNHATADEAAVLFASLGYIVVAADYVGYGASNGVAHPYLRAEPSAAATVDLLTAARTWRQRSAVADNGQLFLAGYSEGGYTTMAAHRALQLARSPHAAALLVAVPGAGPYHVGVTLDTLLQRVRDEVPALAPLLDPGVLRFLDASVRRQLREELVKRLIPVDADVVFDTSVLDDYLADNTLALELRSNVHDWAPQASVRLFHGRDDQTVPFASAERTLQSMRARGAADATLTECTAVPASHIGCVPQYLGFVLDQLALRARDL